MILGWFENRASDEIPAENLWEDPKGLERWWERIKDRKDYSKGRTDFKDEDLAENELARQFKEG